MVSRRSFLASLSTVPFAGLALPEPSRSRSAGFLDSLAFFGLRKRFYGEPPAGYWARLEAECRELVRRGLDQDVLCLLRLRVGLQAEGLLVGPRVGALSGLLVSYALQITNLDPVRRRMSHENFLESPNLVLDVEEPTDCSRLPRALEARGFEWTRRGASFLVRRRDGSGATRLPTVELLPQPLLTALSSLEQRGLVDFGAIDPDSPGLIGSLAPHPDSFLFEDRFRRHLLRALPASRFEDLLQVWVAGFRPYSALSRAETRARLLSGAVARLHPALEPFVRDSRGLLLFEEQHRAIARELAGITERRPYRIQPMEAWDAHFMSGLERVAGLSAREASEVLRAVTGSPRVKRSCASGMVLFSLWIAEARRRSGTDWQAACVAVAARDRRRPSCSCRPARPLLLVIPGGDRMCSKCCDSLDV